MTFDEQMTKIAEKDTRAIDNAQAHLASITELMNKLNKSTRKNEDSILDEIIEYALSAEVVKTYEILLSTGGPAAKITGTLNEYDEPDTAELFYQDWFEPWTKVPLTDSQESHLIQFARCYYFGE